MSLSVSAYSWTSWKTDFSLSSATLCFLTIGGYTLLYLYYVGAAFSKSNFMAPINKWPILWSGSTVS